MPYSPSKDQPIPPATEAELVDALDINTVHVTIMHDGKLLAMKPYGGSLLEALRVAVRELNSRRAEDRAAHIRPSSFFP